AQGNWWEVTPFYERNGSRLLTVAGDRDFLAEDGLDQSHESRTCKFVPKSPEAAHACSCLNKAISSREGYWVRKWDLRARPFLFEHGVALHLVEHGDDDYDYESPIAVDARRLADIDRRKGRSLARR